MPKDISASVRQKLLNKARSDGRPFDELFQYFVIERFLYRLSTSKYKDQFVLKGALLFRVWTAEEALPYSVLKSELTGSPDKQKKWAGFLEKSQLLAPHSFADLLDQLAQIISPILDSVLTGSDLADRWNSGGPWI